MRLPQDSWRQGLARAQTDLLDRVWHTRCWIYPSKHGNVQYARMSLR
jgi:hypothetical protein